MGSAPGQRRRRAGCDGLSAGRADDNGFETLGHAGELVTRLQVAIRAQGCARFLQSLTRGVDGPCRVSRALCRCSCRDGLLQAIVGVGQRLRDLGDEALGFAADGGLLGGGLLGSLLGALSRVERETEGQPIVTLTHGFVVLAERFHGRREVG